jgi:outer membrane receptor protein involved in Fe transport
MKLNSYRSFATPRTLGYQTSHCSKHAAGRASLTVCLALLGVSVHAAPAANVADLSLEQLLQVTVTGAAKYEQRQSEVAAAVSVITRQEIKAHGWRTLDEALASLPGVYTTYDRQYAYLGTRGFSVLGDFNTRILLTINGNRVNDAVYDQAYVGRDFPLDIDLVERIEFIPGPGGAVYGQNAMFGVVNVVTRSGASLAGTQVSLVNQQPQRRSEARISWGQRFEGGPDVLLSFSALRARGEDRFYDYGPAGVSGVAAGRDGERDQEWLARVAYGGWNLELVQGDRRKDDPTGYYHSDPLVSGTYQRDRMVLAQMGYEGKAPQPHLGYSARVFLGRERFTSPQTYSGQAAYMVASSNWHGLELRTVYTGLPGHKLMLGWEGQRNSRVDQTFDELDTTPGQLDVAVLRSGWRLGLYGQDEWTLTPKLSATLGARLDRSQGAQRSVSPRAGLVWQASDSSTFKALYGQAFRPPNVYEREYADGVTQRANPELRGETISTLELVGEHRSSRDLAFRVSAYRWRILGLVTAQAAADTDMDMFVNGPGVWARGLELGFDSTWARGGRLRASGSFQNTTRADGTTQPNSPQRLLKANWTQTLPWAGLLAGLELRHESARISSAGAQVAGATLAHLSLSASLARGMELWLGLHNALGVKFSQPGSRNTWQDAIEQDGRSLRLRLMVQM